LAVESLYMEWQDANGAFFRTRNYMQAGSNPAAVLAAIQGLCNAGLQQQTHGGVTTFTATPPIAGIAYDAIYQNGSVSYATVLGNGIRVTLPALIKANLLADGIRINPVALAALDLAVLATLTDNLGNAAAARTTAILIDRRNDLQ
jgi:hypothetical protein